MAADVNNFSDRTQSARGATTDGLDAVALAHPPRSLHHGRQHELCLSSIRLAGFDPAPPPLYLAYDDEPARNSSERLGMSSYNCLRKVTE